MAMFPHERSLVKRLESKPFALIGVNSDRNLEEAKKKSEDQQITWRSFWNGGSTNGQISREWQVRGWPTLYLIDQRGVIREKWMGAPSGDKMTKAVEALVKEAEEKE